MNSLLKHKQLLFMIFAFVISTSCSNNELYHEYKSVQNADWSKDNALDFPINITDTINSFDVFLEIRNNNEYKFRNLWLFVNYKTPQGAVRKDTIDCELADVYGKWHGKGTTQYTLDVPFEQNVRFQKSGTYVYSIRQGMREDNLKGISDIGIRIVKQSN